VVGDLDLMHHFGQRHMARTECTWRRMKALVNLLAAAGLRVLAKHFETPPPEVLPIPPMRPGRSCLLAVFVMSAFLTTSPRDIAARSAK